MPGEPENSTASPTTPPPPRESAVASATTIAPPVAERSGDRIGRYKLLEKIGEGGMGTVHVALQEEPVRRKVALKIIKLGMDTREVVARFEAERQALALMNHPNIAKVLDAGSTDNGRPYFVMEWVQGEKITDYCDRHSLSTRARLDLFIQVCAAIQHAHQKGVIHRDIKPSNILVTVQEDGQPSPKVIDFGIAKATAGQRLTDKTLHTAVEQFIGTPAYMSPEQAEMTSADVDTRGDIYSLGVVLYELLTGKTPFDSKRLVDAGLDEIRRIIREEDPPRPSTRLSTLSAEEQTTVAQRRQSVPPRLIHSVRGDLDWIVMRCLEKDRTRRYETANGLAMDIERHLNNEPVLARPPSTLYRLQKVVRRNRLAFAAGAAVVASLVLGLGFSLLTLGRERAARQRAAAAERVQASLRQQAETEAARSREVATFLKRMLSGVGPSVALGRDTIMLREILDQTAGEVGTELKGQPAVEADLRLTLGEVYFDLAEDAKAEAMFRRALDLKIQLLGKEHPETAIARRHLGEQLLEEGKLTEAEELLRRALAVQRAALGPDHEEIAMTLHAQGRALRLGGRLPEAESAHREALAMQRRLFGNQNLAVATALNYLGIVLRREHKAADAVVCYREAMTIKRSKLGEGHPDVIQLQNNLAVAMGEEGNFEEEEQMFRQVLEARQKFFARDHPYVATAIHNLATAVERRGRFAEAETLYRKALEMRRATDGAESPSVGDSLDALGGVLAREKNLAQSEMQYREALALRRKILRPNHPDLAISLCNLASVLSDQTNYVEATSLYRDALEIYKKVHGPDSPAVAETLANLAVVLEKMDKLNEAETAQREALAILKRKAPDRWKTFEAESRLGGILLARSQYAEAEPLLLSGYEGMKRLESKIPAYDKPRLKKTIEYLVALYEATHADEKAAKWRNQP